MFKLGNHSEYPNAPAHSKNGFRPHLRLLHTELQQWKTLDQVVSDDDGNNVGKQPRMRVKRVELNKHCGMSKDRKDRKGGKNS